MQYRFYFDYGIISYASLCGFIVVINFIFSLGRSNHIISCGGLTNIRFILIMVIINYVILRKVIAIIKFYF